MSRHNDVKPCIVCEPPRGGHGDHAAGVCEWERLAAKLGVSDVQKPVP